MAGVIKEANYLLGAINDFMIAYLTGIGERHCPAFGILGYMLYAYQKVLHFARLLPDSLRKNNF